jgi:hypothetical protein
MRTISWITFGLGIGLLVTTGGSCAAQGPVRPIRPSSSPSAELDKEYPHRPHVGMNLASLVDYSREWPLVDAYKTSRPWIQKGPGAFSFDEHGNPRLQPGQSVSTLLLREIDGHYPKGTYVATYEGKGTIDIHRWDVTRYLKEAPGRIELDVLPRHGGIQIEVTASDPQDPIRNIHVWMPGFEKAKSPFHPLYLERLKPFGVLRFMDWQRTNNSPLITWSQRAKLTDSRYSSDAGAPLELMIDLANTSRSHPWFCMPHQADNDYVRQFARLVKERRAPDIKVYVEYSNEVWNGQFAQARYAADRGKDLKLSDNGYQAQLRYYSQRAVEIFKIWEEVFGGPERLVRVMASQSANPWVSEQVLTWKDAYKKCDGLAVAPYFGHRFGDPKTAERIRRLPVAQLIDQLAKEVAGDNRKLIEQQVKLARAHNVELIAYEGGQHLAGFAGGENDDALTEALIAANRHPRMFDLYSQHLANWYEAGGGMYVVFSNVGKPTKWGSWGVLEYQDQPTEEAPKYRAVLDFIKKP